MYTHVSKCKNDKIKFKNKKQTRVQKKIEKLKKNPVISVYTFYPFCCKNS
jgi:hypothetical protein